jgi:hypothetical protein
MATKPDSESALLKKLTHGITGPASTDIERMIVHFDKLTTVRRKRPLTEAEQLVYDSLKHHVGAQFDRVIKQMREGHQGQQSMKIKDTAAAAQSNGQSGGTAPATATPTGTATATPTATPTWQNDSVQSFWLPITAIINFVQSMFTKSSDESPPMTIIGLLKMIGVIDLENTGNKDEEYAGKVDTLTEKLKGSIEKMRETVVSGISGAANASMDMVLNAFSLMPGIGTTLLIWRMFQNVLVILGSSLNVQAGTAIASSAVSSNIKAPGAQQPILSGGGIINKKNHKHRNNNNNNNNNNNSITAGARALHQSLKRFSGMAARMSSAITNSNSKTKRVRQWNNVASIMSAYALKPATSTAAAAAALPVILQIRSPHPILKPVAAA